MGDKVWVKNKDVEYEHVITILASRHIDSGLLNRDDNKHNPLPPTERFFPFGFVYFVLAIVILSEQ